MDRRKLLIALFGVCPLSTVYLLAKDRDDRKGKGKQNKQNQKGNDQGGDQDSRYFRRDDYGAVQRYYNGPRDLPPGLRKKYYRTGKCHRAGKKGFGHFLPSWFAYSLLLRIVSAAILMVSLLCTTAGRASSSIPSTSSAPSPVID